MKKNETGMYEKAKKVIQNARWDVKNKLVTSQPITTKELEKIKTENAGLKTTKDEAMTLVLKKVEEARISAEEASQKAAAAEALLRKTMEVSARVKTGKNY